MKITMKNKPLQKIKAILEIVRERKAREPGKETFSFTFEEFQKSLVLKDATGLSLSFGEIQKEDSGIVFLFPEIPKEPQQHGALAGGSLYWGPPLLFHIHIKDLEKFNEYYKEVKRRLGNIESMSKFIESIICVRPNSGDKIKLVINNNYRNPVKCDKAKLCWDFLFRIAEGEQITNDEKYKSNLDYFNSNKRNRIYAQTGYKITKILKVDGGCIFPNIKMSVINEKAFQRRLKKD